MRKPTEIIHMQVRISEATRRKLAKAAEASGRSMNAEIVWRLEQSLEPVSLSDALQQAKELVEVLNTRIEDVEKKR